MGFVVRYLFLLPLRILIFIIGVRVLSCSYDGVAPGGYISAYQIIKVSSKLCRD